MNKNGIIYIAFGEKAKQSAIQSIESLNCHNKYEIMVLSDSKISGMNTVIFDDKSSKGRWSKVNLDLISPFDQTLYLDADTRITGNISIYFDLLQDFDLVITPSKNQNNDRFWHLSEDDKKAVYQDLEFEEVLQLQAGVFSFRKCQEVSELFEAWREEWLRFRGQDQGALIRALYRCPVKIYLLSNVFNGGVVINHLFGKLR